MHNHSEQARQRESKDEEEKKCRVGRYGIGLKLDMSLPVEPHKHVNARYMQVCFARCADLFPDWLYPRHAGTNDVNGAFLPLSKWEKIDT